MQTFLTKSALVFKMRASTGRTVGVSTDSEPYHRAREYYKSATRTNRVKNTCWSDIWTMIGLENRFNPEAEPKKSRMGTVVQRDQNESTLQHQQNVAIGRTHFLKQRSTGGHDTVETAKHPDLPKTRKYHRETGICAGPVATRMIQAHRHQNRGVSD